MNVPSFIRRRMTPIMLAGGIVWFVVPPVGDAFYLPPSPSYRYITMSAPLFPTSNEECNDLAREFDEEFRTLDDQHESCLAQAPNDEVSFGGTCSKSSCQSLHTAKDEVGKKRNEEVGICRARVGEYLANKRREEAEDRRRAAEAEQDRQDRDRRDQERERDRRNSDRKEREDRDRRADQEKADRDRKTEQDRQDQARRDQDRQRATADQQRRQADALRQAHIRAVTKAADHIKDTWKDRLRTGLPDVVSDLSGFMQIVRGLTRGDGSRSALTDLMVAADTLAERAETAYAWITAPLQTFSDQVTADAIDMVRADTAYQRDDPRVHTIFRGIQKVNEIVHDTNPFTKAISRAAFDQIDTHFKTILGELEHLEADIGSFDYSRRKYADQPLANPFRQAPSTGSAASSTPGNPWRSNPGSSTQEEPFHPEPAAGPGAATGNPFRVDSDSGVPPPASSIPAVTSANPFRAAQTSSGASTSPSRPPGATSLVTPTPGSPTKDRMVLYRDPATRQLSERRLSSLPDSLSGDDAEQQRCSQDGLGIVTETCEQRRQADKAQHGNAAK